MIITLTNSNINKNIKNNVHVLTFVEKELLMMLSAYGMFFNQYRKYRIDFDSVEYSVLCPIIYINNKKIILHPAIKLPGRKYPCYVYLYAAIKYITSDLNMRQIARVTRLKFGLDTFSAATVCRSVNKFVDIKDQIKTDHTINKSEQIKLNPRISFCKKLTKKIAYHLLSSSKAVLNNPILFATQLVYQFFCKTGRFLF